MNLEDLVQRIQVLEDIEAIRRLKARYAALCDDNYDADGIAELFTEDGVWDGDRFGRYEGREAIREFFQGAADLLPFALHYVTNPIIDVHGETATGSWYLFQSCTFAPESQAVWGAARYHDEYVKVEGEWKFRRLTLTSLFWTPYDQGWTKQPFVQSLER